ncbi:MAG: DUF1553 domain-containing protein, partial [Planctomycetota bacterium]|nr:DUF1553 domain-containing protein [Planctomycetota bacterium]
QIHKKEKELQELKPNTGDFEKWLTEFNSNSLASPIEHNSFDDFKSGRNQSIAGRFNKGVLLTGDDPIRLKTGNFSRNQPFSVSIWINTPNAKDRAVILHRSRAWTDAASRGYQLLIENGKLSVSLIHFWPGNAIRIKTLNPIPTNQWMQVGFSYDGSSRANGLSLYLNGKITDTEVVRDNLYKNITGGGGDQITIGERFRDKGFKNGLVDEIKIYDKHLTHLEFAAIHDPHILEQLELSKAEPLDPEIRRKLGLLFLRHHDKRSIEIQKALKSLRDQRSALVDGAVEIMVMNELNPRRATFRLERGAYDNPKETVQPGLPRIFNNPKSPSTRLELANWVVSNENPLTARVTVNRYWQMIFGEGLVRTPEDFGSQGQPPTHPQLLDWLARDFMDHDWNLKRLLKTIVMSATYQQDSTLTQTTFRRDPDNLFLSRAPSFRMQAEMLRDNALFVSGNLINKIGGAGAKPYDLALSFKPIGADNGEGLYRRSVYTYWKRTGPSPVMMTLDASKRDICTVKREKTATPLQAFVLLNDPQFVESAKMLAAKSIGSAQTIEMAIVAIFERLSSRTPTARESRILMELYNNQKQYFEGNQTAIDQYLSIGKKQIDNQLDRATVAALAAVTQVIMNYDECVMRR